MMSRLVGLLTDFGTTDIYVGVMKAVMRGIDPDIGFIDITHHIQPQNVRQAAFALLNSYRYFPPQTVFLVVVDPGVGSARRPIAARADDYLFVAPDNGVLSYALAGRSDIEIVEMIAPEYRLHEVSQTFHGRDIFAPAAAHLGLGVPLEQLGPPVADPLSLPVPELMLMDNRIAGEVVHIDHFGNIITSIGRLRWVGGERLTLSPLFHPAAESIPVPSHGVSVALGGTTVHQIVRSYNETERGDVLALVGSGGFLEIAVNQGNGAARLDVAIGDTVTLQLHD